MYPACHVHYVHGDVRSALALVALGGLFYAHAPANLLLAPGGGFGAWWGRLDSGLWASPKQIVDSLGPIGSAVAVPVALLQLALPR